MKFRRTEVGVKSRCQKRRVANHNALERSCHICTATLRHCCLRIYCPPSLHHTTQHTRHITSPIRTYNTYKHPQTHHHTMPVPMPSTTEKSTSSPATAQTAHNVENASTQSVASASHTQKTQEELDAEKRYEEAMEEEYAKREGGA
jgi:hypothetical protein